MFAVQGRPLEICFWLLIVSAAFDFMDGAAARLLGQYSEIGVQLDSLADMVSFGVAPSAIALSMYEKRRIRMGERPTRWATRLSSSPYSPHCVWPDSTSTRPSTTNFWDCPPPHAPCFSQARDMRHLA
ncbi:MAG: CDP-alcohol phosphatidyltransferase family protein [Alistipes putredinis]|nr:MAG: CDP-alcohol phosphatidyltransferase family protein [Alistipes putredinis]